MLKLSILAFIFGIAASAQAADLMQASDAMSLAKLQAETRFVFSGNLKVPDGLNVIHFQDGKAFFAIDDELDLNQPYCFMNLVPGKGIVFSSKTVTIDEIQPEFDPESRVRAVSFMPEEFRDTFKRMEFPKAGTIVSVGCIIPNSKKRDREVSQIVSRRAKKPSRSRDLHVAEMREIFGYDRLVVLNPKK